MIIRHFVLRKHEIESLSDVMSTLNGDETRNPPVRKVSDRLYAAFTHNLLAYLNAEGETTEVFGKNHARFLRRNDMSGSDGRAVGFLYDFITTSFRTYLSRDFQAVPGSDDEMDRQRLLDLIDKLIGQREDEMKNVPNPLAALISNTQVLNEGEGVPTDLMGNYIGYRRSSERGDIVRFVIELSQNGLRRTIRFRNEYLRNNDHWYVDGMGYSVQGTLYLIGHCTNHSGVSRGLRIMALRPHRQDKHLFGLLVSMDRQDPISARILLVPANAHNLACDPENFDALVNEILIHDQDMPYGKLLDVLREQLPDRLAEPTSDLFKTICNANFSVLKGNPERDADIIDAELEFRNAFVGKFGHGLGDMREAYLHMLNKAVQGFKEQEAPEGSSSKPWLY